MAAVRSAKAGQQRRERGGSERGTAASSRAPLSPGRNPPPDLLSEVSEPQLFSGFSDLTLMAFLAVAAVLPYLNTLPNYFVSDDEMQVLHNPYIRNFHYLGKIFTTPVSAYFPGTPNYYRPLMNVGYLLCYQVFGSRPLGYHLANVLMHAAVVCVVFLLTLSMFRDRDWALATTALFAIHPIHSEVVAWIAASPDLELSLFYVLTFWFFLAGPRSERKFSHLAQLAMAGSFVLTLLSKEQAVTLPVLASVYEHYYRDDREETRITQKVQRYAGLWLLTVAYLLFRVRVLGKLGSGFTTHILSGYQTFLSALTLLGQHLWKLLWPVDMRAFCPFHAPTRFLDLRVLGGLAALAVCSVLFVFLWRRARPLSFALLWLLALLGPVLNARWMPNAAFEERYLYLPSLGFCWLLGWGFLWLRARACARSVAWSRALAAAFGILAALCSLRIVTRNRDWEDSTTLYANTLAACPDAYYVRRDLGAIYYERGDLESAEREWREAFKTEPRYSLTASSLGLVCLRKENYSQALEFFKKALELDPGNPEAHLNLGMTYMDMHSPQLAEPELQAAVSLKPLYSNARNALGMLYVGEGRTAEAEEQFRRSVEIDPNLTAYGNLGLIHWRRGEAKLAEQEWRQALKLAPNDSSLLNNLGLACGKQERYPEAVSFFRKAIELQPNDPNPHSNLGIAYEKSGQHGPAETEFLAALSLSPQKFETRNRLGRLYLEGGRLEEAEAQFHLSLQTQANEAGYSGLGEVYLRRGDRAAAERAFQSAASLDPQNSQVHFRLGALYQGEGRRAEALKEYQAGLKSDPDNRDALAAVGKLSPHARAN